MRRASGVFLLLVLLAGCGLPFQRTGEHWRTYVLEATTPPARVPAAEATCLTLLLDTPRAEAGYETPRMAYVELAHRLDYFAFHRWADAPALLLQPLLVESLEQSGLFSAIIGPRIPATAELRLDVDLLYLRQVFENGDSRVDLGVRVRLSDLQRQALVASRVLAYSAPAEEGTPYGGVQTANALVDRLLVELPAFLNAHLAPRAGCG